MREKGAHRRTERRRHARRGADRHEIAHVEVAEAAARAAALAGPREEAAVKEACGLRRQDVRNARAHVQQRALLAHHKPARRGEHGPQHLQPIGGGVTQRGFANRAASRRLQAHERGRALMTKVLKERKPGAMSALLR